jgi:hypothetical protein
MVKNINCDNCEKKCNISYKEWLKCPKIIELIEEESCFVCEWCDGSGAVCCCCTQHCGAPDVDHHNNWKLIEEENDEF